MTGGVCPGNAVLEHKRVKEMCLYGGLGNMSCWQDRCQVHILDEFLAKGRYKKCALYIIATTVCLWNIRILFSHFSIELFSVTKICRLERTIFNLNMKLKERNIISLVVFYRTIADGFHTISRNSLLLEGEWNSIH